MGTWDGNGYACWSKPRTPMTTFELLRMMVLISKLALMGFGLGTNRRWTNPSLFVVKGMKVREPICMFPFLMLTMRCDQYIPASAMYDISAGKIIRNYYGSVFGNDPPLWCSTTALVEPKPKWFTMWLHQAIIRPVSRRRRRPHGTGSHPATDIELSGKCAKFHELLDNILAAGEKVRVIVGSKNCFGNGVRQIITWVLLRGGKLQKYWKMLDYAIWNTS